MKIKNPIGHAHAVSEAKIRWRWVASFFHRKTKIRGLCTPPSPHCCILFLFPPSARCQRNPSQTPRKWRPLARRRPPSPPRQMGASRKTRWQSSTPPASRTPATSTTTVTAPSAPYLFPLRLNINQLGFFLPLPCTNRISPPLSPRCNSAGAAFLEAVRSACLAADNPSAPSWYGPHPPSPRLSIDGCPLLSALCSALLFSCVIQRKNIGIYTPYVPNI